MARDNRAVPHVQEGNAWRVTPRQRDPDAQTPAGGVSSTARDLVPWVRLQLGQGALGGQRVVPAAALAPAHLPQSVANVPDNPAQQRPGFYGLGFNVSYTDAGLAQWSHSGAFAEGAATAFYLLPGLGVGVLALTNGAPVGAPEAFCLSVLDLVQRGEVTRDWVALVGQLLAATAAETDYSRPPGGTAPAPAPGAPLAPDAYAGDYHNDYYGRATVAASGPGLVLRLGPAPLEFPLTSAGRDVFTWQPVGENATGPSTLTFTVGPGGRATAFADAYLTSGGPGRLTRQET
jgi:hypothetical protein